MENGECDKMIKFNHDTSDEAKDKLIKYITYFIEVNAPNGIEDLWDSDVAILCAPDFMVDVCNIIEHYWEE